MIKKKDVNSFDLSYFKKKKIIRSGFYTLKLS